MDKIELNKKTVSQLERLATKYGAKKINPDGKKKTKAQLVNAVLMAYRLKGGKGSNKGLSDSNRTKGGKYVVLALSPSKKIYLVDWNGAKKGVEKILTTTKKAENELKSEFKARQVTRAAVGNLIIK